MGFVGPKPAHRAATELSLELSLRPPFFERDHVRIRLPAPPSAAPRISSGCRRNQRAMAERGRHDAWWRSNLIAFDRFSLGRLERPLGDFTPLQLIAHDR